MTTPAGWYDDGSGRQRWWDGAHWTEHFAPVVPEAGTSEPVAGDSAAVESGAAVETPAQADSSAEANSPAAAETAAAMESVALAENGASWNVPTPSETTADDGGTPSPAEGPAAAETPSAQPSDWSAPSSSPAYPEAAPSQPEQAPNSPGSTQAYPDSAAAYPGSAPAYPGSAPAYPGSTPAYPGAAPQQQPQQPYGSAAPTYPGSAPGYGAPGGYASPYAAAPAAPAGPTRVSVLGLVGLGLAGLGTILACIPLTFGFGWILLAAGFIVSLISLFLRGRKWPGIAGLVLSVVGTVLGIVMFVFFVANTVNDAIENIPAAPPSLDSGTDDGTESPPAEVEEGEVGSPVVVRQLSGMSEITVTSARWFTDDGSGFAPTNGGYVALDLTWEGTEGTTYANMFFLELETAEGVTGDYDYYVENFPSDELEAGETLTGTLTFDVAQSSSYTLIVVDEFFEEVARIAVTPSVG